MCQRCFNASFCLSVPLSSSRSQSSCLFSLHSPLSVIITTAGGVDGGGGGWRCPCTRWFISPSVSALQEDKPVRAERVREGGRLKESGGVSVWLIAALHSQGYSPLLTITPVSAHKSLHSHQHTQVLSASLFSGGAVQLLENVQKYKYWTISWS